MSFSRHPFVFERMTDEGVNGAHIQIGANVWIDVYEGEVYEELHPKPGKAPRRITVTSILTPSNDNSGTARIGGTTERSRFPGDLDRQKGGTSVMAYTLHSHWKKVSS